MKHDRIGDVPLVGLVECRWRLAEVVLPAAILLSRLPLLAPLQRLEQEVVVTGGQVEWKGELGEYLIRVLGVLAVAPQCLEPSDEVYSGIFRPVLDGGVLRHAR